MIISWGKYHFVHCHSMLAYVHIKVRKCCNLQDSINQAIIMCVDPMQHFPLMWCPLDTVHIGFITLTHIHLYSVNRKTGENYHCQKVYGIFPIWHILLKNKEAHLSCNVKQILTFRHFGRVIGRLVQNRVFHFLPLYLKRKMRKCLQKTSCNKCENFLLP